MDNPGVNIFNYVKDKVKIQDVIRKYTTPRKHGSYYKAVCPFCKVKEFTKCIVMPLSLDMGI